MKVLSFDQASSLTGLAVFVEGKLDKYDLIDLHKCKDSDIRILDMMYEIDCWIATIVPDVVVFEDVSLQTNVSSLIMLARIQGAIMQSCKSRNIPFEIYKPSTWRKALNFSLGRSIKRPELKQQSKDFVKNKYGLDLKDDITDAICIGEAYLVVNERK